MKPIAPLLLLSCLFSCREGQDPPQSTTQEAEEHLEYPTFEPFVASRMYEVLFAQPEKVDLAELAEAVETFDEVNEAGKAAGERAGGIERSRGPSALLRPSVPASEEPLLSLLPVVMIRMAPLWESESWSEDQVLLAQQSATFLSRFAGAPALVFEEDADKSNRAAIEDLVRWFHATVGRPEVMAAMIFTMDDGPYAGLPYETSRVFPSTDTKALDEHIELRLAEIERDGEPWLLQCVRDGELLWSRVVSGKPDGGVRSARFSQSEAQPLGTYGWKVFMRVEWTYGAEGAHIYVDTEGNLLFYFLSW